MVYLTYIYQFKAQITFFVLNDTILKNVDWRIHQFHKNLIHMKFVLHKNIWIHFFRWQNNKSIQGHFVDIK